MHFEFGVEFEQDGSVTRKGGKTTYTVKRYSDDDKTWHKADRSAKIKSDVFILDKDHFLDYVDLAGYAKVAQIYTRVE